MCKFHIDYFCLLWYNNCVVILTEEITPMWWNWQTRGTQNPVVAIPCGFDPHHRHHVRASFISLALFFFVKNRVRSCRCSSFIAKRHARLACSLASALTTTHGRYHLFASTHHFGFSAELQSFLAISVVKNVS